MPRNEAETRAELIDPALRGRGWTEEHIRREVTAGAVEIVGGRPQRRDRGRADYTLRLKVGPETQPVAVALIEAKAEHLPAAHGLEQGKAYADSKRLNVPFVFAANGHQYVEYDRFTGLTTAPLPLAAFPTPAALRERYEAGKGFALDSAAARPLLTRYAGGEGSRRYYQDAAIRATLEHIAQGKKRALLTLATGAGKTFIAVNLLKRIADAGQLRRALFVCDRDELRSQGTAAFQGVFGADAAPVSAGNPEKNARVLIATYQTLDLDSDDADASFLVANYPEHYFSHIVIDECHRSAWGKWRQVLDRNPDAVQIGLTATPRQLHVTAEGDEAEADLRLAADNIRYFGEPVYEYDMGQGIEDGYLAACEIRRFDLFHDNLPANERERGGVARADLGGKRLTDARTGERLTVAEARERYGVGDIEGRLVMPDRVAAMAADLFRHLLATGGPEQKTIVFCARDSHADAVAIALNNLYAAWCAAQGRQRREPYAFKCTAASGGADYLPDFRGASRHHFIATTVDLLTTGVDVPNVRNIAFFKYVRSPIAFYQMVGRGTRLDPATGKLLFRVYDYTDATRLFGHAFITKASTAGDGRGGDGDDDRDEGATRPVEHVIRVEGVEVRVTDAGHAIVTMVDGKAVPLSVEEYKARLAARLVAAAPTLDDFRARWVAPSERRALLAHLPDGGRSPAVVRTLDERAAYDLYDVLADLGYGAMPRTRAERSAAFVYKHEEWLGMMPDAAAATVKALSAQFARAGTEGLENPRVFNTPEVKRAGGLPALKTVGDPGALLRETKERMFAA